jgi:hypothetical protein
VQRELEAREPIYHRPELGTSRAHFEDMTEPGFWETGASGRRYGREWVLDTVVERHARGEEYVWDASDFYCQELAPDLYLLTYTLVEDGTRVTRRATLWRRHGAQWRIVYHQGTVVAQE